MKNAVIVLCMLNDSYAVGACMCAYVHKSIITSNNLNIEVIVMCDAYIYNKYKRMLRFYFDKVYKIELLHYNVIREDIVSESNKKKYNWIEYSINKWQCLKFVEYHKILFLDVDILPVSLKFYDIYNFDTPAFYLMQHNNKYTAKTCVNNTKIYDILNNFETYNDYIKNSNISHYSLNGGIVLMRPNINEYNEYIKFVNNINIINNGIPQMSQAGKSGIDETTLFYYFVKHKKQNFYRICMDYMIIPWVDKTLDNIPDKNIPMYSYNFLSYIKPWRKSTIISFPEESIWRKIYKKMRKSKQFKKLYKKTLIDGINEYNTFDDYHKKRYYGTITQINFELTYDNIVKHENKKYDYGILNIQDIKQLLKYMKYKFWLTHDPNGAETPRRVPGRVSCVSLV